MRYIPRGGLVDDADSAVKMIIIADISAALGTCQDSDFDLVFRGTLVCGKNF